MGPIPCLWGRGSCPIQSKSPVVFFCLQDPVLLQGPLLNVSEGDHQNGMKALYHFQYHCCGLACAAV